MLERIKNPPAPCFRTERAAEISMRLHELDDDHRSCVTAAVAELQDARVATLAIVVLACDFVEELSHDIFISEGCDCLTAGAEVATLCERDELVSEFAELFCFCFRRLNASISEEGSDDTSEKCLASAVFTS